jgi:O-antigen ligase
LFTILALVSGVFRSSSRWLRVTGLAWLLGIALLYLLSTFINGLNPILASQGMYQRNFGIIFWIAVALIFAFSAAGYVRLEDFMSKALPVLLLLVVVYGLLQTLDMDPFPWRNPYDAVQLTLGNPNFSGALIGILSVSSLWIALFSEKLVLRIAGVTSFNLLIYLAFQTKTLQALVVFLIATLVFLFVNVVKLKSWWARAIKVFGGVGGIGLFVGMPVLVFSKFDVLSGLRERFFFQGSIAQRLDYWRTGIEIFKDHPWFGVGPDQFQRYAALYRTKEQVVRDGAFVIPDKAHSVLIDALANGGIFVGLFWTAFVVFIFVKLVQTVRLDLPLKVRRQLAVVGAMWSGYVFQALISPDQLVLAVLGYMSAGLIVYINTSQVKPVVKKSRFELLYEDSIYVRTVLGAILIFALTIWSQAIAADIAAKRVLNNENLTRDSVLAAVNQWPAPKTTELIAIAVSQADSQCDLADELADRLIEVDNRSAQGWYLKAICFNVNREFNEALSASENALKFDPINPTYLVAKAKLGIAAGNKGAASEALAAIKSNYPDNPEIAPLESSISLMP